MKKTLALLLALLLTLGTTCAFAATDAEKEEWTASKMEAVRDMLDENGITYEYSSAKNRVRMEYSLENEFESCLVWGFVKYDSVEFNADYPLQVPKERFADVAALFMRINDLYRLIAFYVEYESGTMGCKSIAYTEEHTPSYECLDYAWWGPIYYAELYGSPIYKLLSGEYTVDQAFAEVEEIYNS